jgi:hypothetical protein
MNNAVKSPLIRRVVGSREFEWQGNRRHLYSLSSEFELKVVPAEDTLTAREWRPVTMT